NTHVLPRLVHGIEEVGHAAVVAELDALLLLLIDELNDQALVQVGLDLQPLSAQLRVIRLVAEDLGIGGERDGRPRAPRRLAGLDGPERLAAAEPLAVR